MAEIAATTTIQPVDWRVYAWETVTESDTASVVAMDATSGDVNIDVRGTFGGASVAVQGSNDGTNWNSVSDTAGGTVAITSAGGASIRDVWPFMRVFPSGGSSQDLDITMSVLRVRT